MSNLDLEKKLKIYRMSMNEYQRACELVGHALKGVEWALFSALWSEHCSYKSSKVHLKKFFNKNPRVLEAEGENAGVIDLGEGERIAFKMESHNHPSFIEPYQGAATGVGGILRDIFTMGARPIALADYLCFGEPQSPRMQSLLDGVVRGIGGYGNCVGVPTVTGQTQFDSSYNNNILVNAMAVGLFRPNEKIALSKASGVGNLVVYVGAKTGKDGVHGASMASESFDKDSEKKKPNVQIGDPFYEKLLIESCLQVIQSGLVVAIQDMGAAGLTSSSFEMASKGQIGMHLYLDQVPLRDSSMTPEEILLSESQERMLLVVEPHNLAAIEKAFSHFALDATPIGELVSEKLVTLYWHGEKLVAIDPDILVEKAPRYERAYYAWGYPNRVERLNHDKLSRDELAARVEAYHASVFGMSREFIYRQYDQRVGTMTARDCESSVAVLRLPDSGRALSIVLGCRSYLMQMDARIGAMDSVAYPALQMACIGAEALAVTDCLNFGNPEKPEIMSEFVASVEGISEICKALNAPVISGNVSFYNETLGKNITSTPATGLVGLRSHVENMPQDYFLEAGMAVFSVQLPMLHFYVVPAEPNSSKEFAGSFDTEKFKSFCDVLRALSFYPQVKALKVVDLSGGVGTLAKMCFKQKLGLDIVDESYWQDSKVTSLYEVVGALPAVELAGFLVKVKSLLKENSLESAVQCRHLGFTLGDGVLTLHQKKVLSLQDLAKKQKDAFGRTFEKLA